jgi:hypothetical protein
MILIRIRLGELRIGWESHLLGCEVANSCLILSQLRPDRLTRITFSSPNLKEYWAITNLYDKHFLCVHSSSTNLTVGVNV